MKINIFEDKDIIILSDEELNNDNFVDLEIINKESSIETTVSIDELKSAVDSFYRLREQQLKKDKLLTK